MPSPTKISSALRVQMSDAERERFYRRYTRNGAAYERYLMGRARLRSVTEQGALQAIAEFEAARDLDPNLRARVRRARDGCGADCAFGSRSQKGDEVWDARARQEARRALQLDPDLAEAHVALAAVHRFQEYDWDTVIRESRRALELNPSLDMPHLYLAVAYFHIGLLDEAELEVKAARELNPENRVEPLEILGAVSLFAGRTADAAGHLSQVQDLSDSRIVKYLLGWTLYYQGERQRAEALLETMIDDEGPLPGNARATLAAIRAARGAHLRSPRARRARGVRTRPHSPRRLRLGHRVRAAPRSHDCASLAVAGSDDRLPLLSVVRARPAARSDSRVIRDSPTSCASCAARGRTHARSMQADRTNETQRRAADSDPSWPRNAVSFSGCSFQAVDLMQPPDQWVRTRTNVPGRKIEREAGLQRTGTTPSTRSLALAL